MRLKQPARAALREGGVAEELAQDSLEAIRSRLADIDALGGLPYRRRAAVSLRYWADWTDWTDDQRRKRWSLSPTRSRSSWSVTPRPSSGDRASTPILPSCML